jgi:hypothetical protein
MAFSSIITNLIIPALQLLVLRDFDSQSDQAKKKKKKQAKTNQKNGRKLTIIIKHLNSKGNHP